MGIEDHTLPAVVHLTGDGARDVLDAAVRAAGGTLGDLRVSQIQYRPGDELVVRYRCDVQWPDGHEPRDTLLAATTSNGPLPGAVPVVAETDEGTLEVSVWRWPFDPILPGLPVAVTGAHLAARVRQLGVDIDPGPVTIDVLAYRPTERAVIRLRPASGPLVYVKVVPPATTAVLAERHRVLLDGGLPVPEVLAVSEADGLLVLAELPGTTLRDRIKEDLPGWPPPAAFAGLVDRLATVPVDGLPAIRGRLRDAVGHAGLLRRVAPERTVVLDSIIEAVRDALPAADARTPTVVHGDLHEAQVIVGDGAITGLLDIDDVGVGDPLSDMATLVGHLRFRGLVTEDPTRRRDLLDYADGLRRSFAAIAADRVDDGARALDVLVGAVLVGLATGPFRIQRDGWRDEIGTVLDDAAVLTGALASDG